MDSDTAAVFRIYIEQASRKKIVQPDIRNTLIKSLHYKYGVAANKLGDMFHLKLRTIKGILKTLTTVVGAGEIEELAAPLRALNSKGKIRTLVMREISS